MAVSTPNTIACDDAIQFLNRSRRRQSLSVEAVDSQGRLEELWTIDKDAYGDASLTLEAFSGWLQRYRFGSRNLISENKIIASIGLYPISEEQAIDFTAGRIRESDLEPVTTEECDMAPQKYWYASGIVVIRELRGFASPLPTLLQMSLSSWLDSGHLTFPLTVLGLGEYTEGKRLMTAFGLTKQVDGSSLPDGFDLYSIELSFSHARSFLRSKVY